MLRKTSKEQGALIFCKFSGRGILQKVCRKKYSCLANCTGMAGDSFSKMKLPTPQAMCLHTPGEVVGHSNRNILKISPDRFELFKKLLAA